MRLNFDVVATLRTQAKHNYIHSNFNADTFQYTNISDPTNMQRPQPNPTMSHPKASVNPFGVIHYMDMEEPCKGDTLSKPRAQALG